MTKLITETPDHPIPFLIGHLQTKQESPGRIQRTLSGSAALWADSSSGGFSSVPCKLFGWTKCTKTLMSGFLDIEE